MRRSTSTGRPAPNTPFRPGADPHIQVEGQADAEIVGKVDVSVSCRRTIHGQAVQIHIRAILDPICLRRLRQGIPARCLAPCQVDPAIRSLAPVCIHALWPEQARLADPACRLLTILGPGGAGKTSLALQATATLTADATRFPAGVFFAPLAGVTAGELIAPAILQALGVPPRSSMDLQHQLIEHLAERRLLLVLDNFEHLLRRPETGDERPESEDGAALLMAVLQGAPGVKLLVTSRERLDLRDEWLLPLGGLALPPDDGSGDLGSDRSASLARMTEPAVVEELSAVDLLAAPTPAPPDLEAHAATQLFLNGLVCFCLEGLGRLELELGRPTRAAELYRQSLAFIEQTGMTHDYHTPIALAGAGRAALALGHLAKAKDYQRQALRCPVYWVHDRAEMIATLAQICALEGNVLRAVELLAFAVAQPAVSHRVRQPMARLLVELEAELPAEQFALAVAR